MLTKVKYMTFVCALAALAVVATSGNVQVVSAEDSSSTRLVWDSPSTGWNETVPLGNGEVGVNAYFDGGNGVLRLLVARTDSWDELGRLAKLAEVGIAGFHTQDYAPEPFRQTFDVERGDVQFTFGPEGRETRVSLWVETSRPNIIVEVDSDVELSPYAYFYIWRGEERDLIPKAEISDLFWGSKTPAHIFPDVVASDELVGDSNRIAIFHRNVKTPYFDEVSKEQGMDDFPGRVDPLVDRTFGVLVSTESGKRVDGLNLAATSGKHARFEIVATTQEASESPESWFKEAASIADAAQAVSIDQRRQETLDYWREFNDRSWLRFSPNPNALTDLSDEERAQVETETFELSRGYAFQRFIFACEGRGKHPIKFNGGIFCTAPVKGAPGRHDYRRWGPGYWFQNTRLPYYSMLSSGDFELMKPFFDMYCGLIPFCEYRVKKYFGDSFEGAYFPECIYYWGDVFPETYGLTPWNEREDRLQESRWHRWEWVGGLELSHLALQYYDYTQDETFLQEKAIPTANSVLKFFTSFYKVDPTSGKLKMSPSQALETWQNCDDPTPEIAGIRAVLAKLLALPEEMTTESDRAFWRDLLAKTPEIPTRIDETSGKRMLAPAGRFDENRNVETPEMYPVFPFRLFSFEQPRLDEARLAMERRLNKFMHGWAQDDLFFSYLGDRENVRKNLSYRAHTKDEGSRFPAFWGPNFDWTPDQDHGGVLCAAAQSVVLQVNGDKLYLSPSCPKEWNVDFKLHAPKNTTLEGRLVDGRVVDLKVTPESRKDDVVVVE